MNFARVAVLIAIDEGTSTSGEPVVITARYLFQQGDGLLDAEDLLGALNLYRSAIQTLSLV
jgi:hypothetical protein